MIPKPIDLRAVVEAIDARDPETDSLFRYSRVELIQMAARVLKETPIIKERVPDDHARKTTTRCR
jgi:hypothetical protein